MVVGDRFAAGHMWKIFATVSARSWKKVPRAKSTISLPETSLRIAKSRRKSFVIWGYQKRGSLMSTIGLPTISDIAYHRRRLSNSWDGNRIIHSMKPWAEQ